MSQYPSPSQTHSSPYETPTQQPGSAQPAGPRYVRVSLPTATPYVAYTILGLTILVFLLQVGVSWLLGFTDGSARLDAQQVIAGYISGARPVDWLEAYGAQVRQLILMGQLWRFLTPMLLHASIVHIGLNMYGLLIFGPGLERSFGHWRFLLLYLLSGFAGNVLSFLHTPGPSIGASTALFGLVAAEGIFLFQNRRLFADSFRGAITNIIIIVALNLFLIGRAPGIDNWGHVGGLLGGLIFAWFAGPKWEVEGMMPALHVVDKREARDVITGAAIVLLIFSALAVWGMGAPILP